MRMPYRLARVLAIVAIAAVAVLSGCSQSSPVREQEEQSSPNRQDEGESGHSGTGGATVWVPEGQAGPWQMEKLLEPPAYEWLPEYDAGQGVKALQYDGLPYRGEPTTVFAYIGIPENAKEAGSEVPAVVLVHGGLGTAYADWVQKWNARGYAAIAMDLEGNLPIWQSESRSYARNPFGGPSNQAVWQDLAEPVEEQWTYHAVADIILGHSLLASMAGVDAERIGITGVSWGAVLTAIAVGTDARYKFAIPVYGSGFVAESESYFGVAYSGWGPELQEKFRQLWEPARYLQQSDVPMLWINGDSDSHFPLTVFTRSYALVEQQSTLSIQPGMQHGQEQAIRPEEIYRFADSIAVGGTPLARIMGHTRGGIEVAVTGIGEGNGSDRSHVVIRASSEAPIVKAELYYTLNISDRLSPVWNRQTFQVSVEESGEIRIEGDLPQRTKAYYVNLIDEHGATVSTGLADVPQ